MSSNHPSSPARRDRRHLGLFIAIGAAAALLAVAAVRGEHASRAAVSQQAFDAPTAAALPAHWRGEVGEDASLPRAADVFPEPTSSVDDIPSTF